VTRVVADFRWGNDRAGSGKMPGRRAARCPLAHAARHYFSNQESVVSEVIEYKSWVCLICGWIYNEEEGLPDEGIPAGTRFDDISDDWRCPLCDVGKSDFVVVEF
jgi:rubredoxin